MNCPFCQTPLSPAAAECPACRLTFSRTAALLGAMPMVQAGMGDTTRSMGFQECQQVKERIEIIEQHFPQMVVQVVLHAFPKEHPFGLYAFWIFNAGVFSSQSNRGVENHTLLLLIDPERGEAALMPGYGLEPFLPPGDLDPLLDLAAPDWAEDRWLDGILKVLDGLERLLAATATPVSELPLPAGSY